MNVPINCIILFLLYALESKKKLSDDQEDEVVDKDEVENPAKASSDADEDSDKFFYKRLGRYFLFDTFKGEKGHSISSISLTSAAYHPSVKLLITGYSHGAFLLHEMPEVNLIHSLKVRLLYYILNFHEKHHFMNCIIVYLLKRYQTRKSVRLQSIRRAIGLLLDVLVLVSF